MKEKTNKMGRLTPDRTLLMGILVLQAAILTCLFWQPAQREPSLLFRDRGAAEGSGGADGGIAESGVSGQTEADGLAGMALSPAAFDPGEETYAAQAVPADLVFRHTRQMRSRMDAAFRETMHAFVHMDGRLWGGLHGGDMPFPFPAIDMREHGDAYMIVSSLPGIDSEQMGVVLSGRTLTLTALQVEGGSAYRGVRHFRRTFRFPGPVVNDRSAVAWVSNGVLRVVIPKAVEEEPVRKVLHLL